MTTNRKRTGFLVTPTNNDADMIYEILMSYWHQSEVLKLV
jgi:hypothetical protein